jgi:hypothetical protein
MAAEPVMAAATDFARATNKLPAKAAQTVKTVLLFAIVSRQVPFEVRPKAALEVSNRGPTFRRGQRPYH